MQAGCEVKASLRHGAGRAPSLPCLLQGAPSPPCFPQRDQGPPDPLPVGTAGRAGQEGAGRGSRQPHPSWAGQAPLTPTHQVLPKHGQAEVSGQRGEEGADAREQLLEARGARDEVAEGADAEDAVRVRADDVVVAGGQVVCLHQLRGQKGSRGRDRGTAFWVVPSRPGRTFTGK